MKLRSNEKITLLFLACAMASAAQATHKTAFTGIWKLNVAKSNFGGQPLSRRFVAKGGRTKNHPTGEGRTVLIYEKQ